MGEWPNRLPAPSGTLEHTPSLSKNTFGLQFAVQIYKALSPPVGGRPNGRPLAAQHLSLFHFFLSVPSHSSELKAHLGARLLLIVRAMMASKASALGSSALLCLLALLCLAAPVRADTVISLLPTAQSATAKAFWTPSTLGAAPGLQGLSGTFAWSASNVGCLERRVKRGGRGRRDWLWSDRG